MNTMQKVIVFGATGNLGAYVALYLKSKGYDVVAVGHRKNDNGFFASKGMQYLSVDITKLEDFKQLPQHSDLYHPVLRCHPTDLFKDYTFVRVGTFDVMLGTVPFSPCTDKSGLKSQYDIFVFLEVRFQLFHMAKHIFHCGT